jgi:hypothetical protein
LKNKNSNTNKTADKSKKIQKQKSIPAGKDRSRFKTQKYQNANTIKEK